MLVCLRQFLKCLHCKRSPSKAASVQPRTSVINSSTYISSVRQHSLKAEYPNDPSAQSVSASIYNTSRVQSLPAGSVRVKLDENTEKHFSSLMMKRQTKELICPEGMDQYREVGGVLMLGKQLRQPVEDTF